jgi:opacity protein-like surface antigen
MKTLNIALLAAALVTSAAPAFAADAPSFKDRMTNLWIATGDAGYAHAAGLSDGQISAAQRQAHETVSLTTEDSNGN